MPKICWAISQAVANSDLSQNEIARRTGVTQQAFSKWTIDTEPKLDKLARIEEVLDLPRGALLRTAGYVENVESVEEAIRSEVSFSTDARRWLLVMVEQARSSSRTEAKPAKPSRSRSRK